MLMRLSIILWLAVWLLAARPALAQVPPPAPTALRADSPAAAPSDTAAALHRYFAQRRRNGHVSLGVGGGLLAVSALSVGIGSQQGGWNGLGYVVLGAVGAIISVPVVVRGIVLTATHSKAREQRVVQAWQQRRLPSRLARRAMSLALTWDESLR